MSSDSAPVLSLRDAHVSYGTAPRVHALRGVSIDVFPGEMVAIEGPSGGGKSTLLNVLGLLQTTSSGSYIVNGVDASSASDAERTRMRSGDFAFIFQSFHMLAGRPARDSITVALSYAGVSPDDALRRADAALAKVGLSAAAEQDASTLSGGQQQRVAIARALASDAPVLIADEPTGNLDSENSRQIMDALCELRDDGVAVVIATHEAAVAARADRRVRVRDGLVVDADRSSLTSLAEAAAPDPRAAIERQSGWRWLREVGSDALASLRSRRSRTAGLVGAVSVAVALVVGTLGLGTTASAQVSDAFNARENRYVTLDKDAVDLTVQAQTVGWQGSDGAELVTSLRAIAGVTTAALLLGGEQSEILTRPGQASQQLPVYESVGDLQGASDSEVTWAEGYTGADGSYAIVGSNAAENLGLGPLDAWPTVWVNGEPYSVVGVLNDSPRLPRLTGAIVLIGDQARATAERLEIEAATVLLTVGPGAAAQVAEQARAVVLPQAPDELRVAVPQDPRDLREQIETSVTASLAVLSLIAIAAAVLALANAMNFAVSTRRSEFGLRRAVGASPRDLFALVLAEAASVGIAGGLVGLVVGYVAIFAVTIARRWTPVVEPSLIPLALVGGVLVGAVAGAAAARQAARVDPALALRM